MNGYDPSAIGFTNFKLSGLEARMQCPFHNDHTPSARFNLKTGLFHCFGCGTSMNSYQLARALDGHISTIDIDSIVTFDEEKEWRQLLYSNLAYDNPYLISRGVTNEQIGKFQIMENDDGILFPIKDRNDIVVGIQMRKYEGEPRYCLYGQRTPVWPLSNLRYESLILVEGVFGVMRANLYGFRAVCTMGASAIPPATAALNGRHVKIMFDDDTPGYFGAYSFMRLHTWSEAVLPGVEADELFRKEWIFNVSKIGSRNIVEFAHKRKMTDLLSLIERKEKKDVKKKPRIYAKMFTPRTIGHT